MSQSNFQQKDMTGVLFYNSYKDKDTQPNYKGKVMIEGKDIFADFLCEPLFNS